MDARERKEILGAWGVRAPTPPEEGEARRLAEDLEGSPLAGKPLRARLCNFRPAVDGYEARLPMDPRTGDYVLVAGEPYRLPRLDAE